MDKTPIPEMYAHVVHLATNAEAIAWNRFNNFLVGVAFLVTAWATVFAGSNSNVLFTSLVLYAICVIGVLAGLVWSSLGARSRKYVDLYNEMAKKIEIMQLGEEAIRPFLETSRIRPSECDPSSSTWLMKYVPWIVSGLFAIMLMATVCRQLGAA